jgi:microsomal dipeptidase-like Zn-dependent dipeptidase
MAYDFNIDIHCHSSWKPYMSGRSNPAHTPFETYANEIQRWWLKPLSRQIENAVHVKLATQSNFDSLYKGRVKVVMVSLAPIEKAFFAANVKANGFFSATFKNLVAVRQTATQHTLKTTVVNALTGFYTTDIEFTKHQLQNYFLQALVPEYNYFVQFNNRQSSNENYTIQFVKNYTAIEAAIAANRATICVILSVEGAHTLSSHAPAMAQLNGYHGNGRQHQLPHFSSLADYAANITALKQWEFPPFYLTLNHHFWNGLAGHAQSLSRPLDAIVSQAQGMNEGLKEMGRQVIQLLLDKNNGPRILIDIKHMSPQCRKDFYHFIQTQYWGRGDKFPLLCSHTGVVSKCKTLDALLLQNDDAELYNNSNYLHETSINLCAEDVLMIAETNGLIGLQLDARRIAGNHIITVVKKNRQLNGVDLRRQYIKVLFANIFYIVQTVNTPQGWNIISIGSDYDGFIHHFDCYPTAAELPVLRNDMLQFLNHPEEIYQPGFNYRVPLPEIKRLLFNLSPEAIIEKIFAGNAMAFLQNNFNR